MYINYDHHNQLWKLSESTVGYICNVCNREAPISEMYHREDGSTCICNECIRSIADVLNSSVGTVVGMVYHN